MSKLHDLIAKVGDPALRDALAVECRKLEKGKKFGLVFEEHLPEATPLYDIEIKPGMNVATRVQDGGALFIVKSIADGKAVCIPHAGGEETEFPIEDLVAVATFGEPIYPYLKKLDSVENGGGDLWHTLIQADNYHALQLLEYLYAGKVDCIYIDPPYNTGARDWKYNNDYVDGNDAWRHSKWLSMMEKRLKLAKKLLNPKDSVMIVTIDEKEYLHLGMLLEQLFSEARIQMVSSIIKPEGTQRNNEFSRTNEYVFFVMFGESRISASKSNMFWEVGAEKDEGLDWRNLRRRENSSVRAARPNQFYPIFVNRVTGCINSIGEALSPGVDRNTVPVPFGCYAVYPLAPDGTEMLWSKHYLTACQMVVEGYIKTVNGTTPDKVGIKYLSEGTVEDILSGNITVTGRGPQNEVQGHYGIRGKLVMPKSNWNMPSHNAQTSGSLLLKQVIGDNRFSFPKSLYAVHDTLRFFVANKPNALILDFFAGSGTTLHAVNLLNAEDGGKRRCIMVTNNEVSEAEAKSLREKGCRPGDEEWEKLGIARYVTWPRTVCSIEGHDVSGKPLKGDYGVEVDDYVVNEEDAVVSKSTGKPVKTRIYKKTKRQMYPKLAEMKMCDGFKANAAFFKLGFLKPSAVALGRKLAELLPVLWLKAGGIGKCPEGVRAEEGMVVLPENKMAILFDETLFADFRKAVYSDDNVETVYIATDFEPSFRSMAKAFADKTVIQLYRDYLDSFRLNTARN